MHAGTGSQERGTATAEPAAATECEHEPDAGTAYTSTGLKADLRRQLDYPAEAQCCKCGQWIRKEQYAVSGPDARWHLKYPEPV
jgi:hypothetical protein